MKNSSHRIRQFRIWTDGQGQDLIEYALLTGVVAFAAGAIVPGVASEISQILSKLPSTMPAAVSQGSLK